MGRYLNAASHNHSLQKKSLIEKLFDRVKKINEQDSFIIEIDHVVEFLRKNVYSQEDIDLATGKKRV